MREFTISEVLEYSKNIEKESYTFYTTVSQDVTASELKDVATELAEEELKHFNRINTLLKKNTLSKDAMDKRIQIKKEDYEYLVSTRELPDHVTPLSILETAYEREVKTESVYRTLLSFTDLSDDVVEVFSDLMLQEKGHASKIKSIMKQYT